MLKFQPSGINLLDSIDELSRDSLMTDYFKSFITENQDVDVDLEVNRFQSQNTRSLMYKDLC